MVELNYKVFIVGMICLVVMYVACLIIGHDETMIITLVAGFIGMATGVMIPSPTQVKNKKGVLKW